GYSVNQNIREGFRSEKIFCLCRTARGPSRSDWRRGSSKLTSATRRRASSPRRAASSAPATLRPAPPATASCIRSSYCVWRPDRGDLGGARAGRPTSFLGLRRRLAVQHLGHRGLGLRLLQWPHWSQATSRVHGCRILYSYSDRAAAFPLTRNDLPT